MLGRPIGSCHPSVHSFPRGLAHLFGNLFRLSSSGLVREFMFSQKGNLGRSDTEDIRCEVDLALMSFLKSITSTTMKHRVKKYPHQHVESE